MHSYAALIGLVAAASAHYMHDPRVLTKKQDYPAGTCGPDYGGAVCAEGECCSEYGWCGATIEYCAAPGCQADYSGTSCDSAITPPGDSTDSILRPQLGSIPYGTIITDCTVPGKMALTFDDGPYIYTADLLDVLAANDAKATFFINANNGGKSPIYEEDSDYPALVQKMHNDGHQIASHSWSHADLDAASPEDLKNEIIKNEMAFNLILGFIPTYFRPPYGNCGSACQSELDTYGYHIILWDLDTLDWEVGAEGGAANFDAGVSPSSPLEDSFICLAHDIVQTTVQSLALHMILTAKDAGYDLVTVGECLGDDKANWYRNPTDGGSWNSNPGTTATPTPTPTPTPGTSSSEESSSSAEPSDSAEPTNSAEPTDSAQPTHSAEPSGEHSAEPSGEPSSEPTGEPSTKPTGEPTETPEPTGEPTGETTCSKCPEPTGEPTITDGPDGPEPTGEHDGHGGHGDDEDIDEDEDEPEYTPPPTVVTTVCSNEHTTVTLTYTSTYCPRPTAPFGAGHFGAPDSEGIYTDGWQSPNRTTTTWDGHVHYPTGGYWSHTDYSPRPTGSAGGCGDAGCGGGNSGGNDGASGGASGDSSPTGVSVSSGAKVVGSLFFGLAAAVLAI